MINNSPLHIVPSWMEKITNKLRYSIGQGIERKFKSKISSPEVIARSQKDVSLGPTPLRVVG